MSQQHCDRAVVFRSREAPRVVLAGQQSALAVAAIAIAVIRWTAEDRDLAGLLAPAQHAVVGDIAEHQVASVAKPYRTFRPSRAGVETLDRAIYDFVFCETRINHL